MKYLIFLLLLLSACSKDLKVGDCIAGHLDSGWYVCKITKVGRFSYENVCTDGNSYVTNSKDVDQVDCF